MEGQTSRICKSGQEIPGDNSYMYITDEDREKLAAEVRMLKKENKKLNAQLQSANMDSEIIRQIRYCVDTVLHEAEIPEKKESVMVMLKADRTPAPQKRIHKKEELSM